MTTVILSHLYPRPRRETFGIFIEEEAVQLSHHMPLEVISPVFLPRHVKELWFLPRYEIRRGIPVHRPRLPGFPRGSHLWYNSFFMARRVHPVLCRINDVKLLVAHSVFPDGVAAVHLGRKMGLRTIIVLHGSDINQFAFSTSNRDRRLRGEIAGALRVCDGIIAVSHDLKGKAEDLGADTDKIYIIPNGVDTTLFRPLPRVECEKILELSERCKRVLFVGNFVGLKGLDVLCESIGSIRNRFPRLELVLVGGRKGSPEERSLLKRASGLGIGDIVRSVGIVSNSQIPLWMGASDVLVLPSRSEGFGVVLIEALACGLPVIATRSGGPEDIITDGTGILIQPDNVGELNSAMTRVLDGSMKFSRQKLVARVRGRFDYDTVGRKLVEVYDHFLRGNEP